MPLPMIQEHSRYLGGTPRSSSAAFSPLRLGVDLPLVRDPAVRLGMEDVVRIRRGVVGTVAGAAVGITDGASARIGFSSSPGNQTSPTSVMWRLGA